MLAPAPEVGVFLAMHFDPADENTAMVGMIGVARDGEHAAAGGTEGVKESAALDRELHVGWFNEVIDGGGLGAGFNGDGGGGLIDGVAGGLASDNERCGKECGDKDDVNSHYGNCRVGWAIYNVEQHGHS
jgi:hypothetical protein